MAAASDILKRNTRWQAGAGNLSAIVDMLSENQVQTRVGRNPSVQVDHRAAFLPLECVLDEAACREAIRRKWIRNPRVGRADNCSLIVHTLILAGNGARRAAEGSQVNKFVTRLSFLLFL